MTFTAVDASGNSADCKIILYVGGKNTGCKTWETIIISD